MHKKHSGCFVSFGAVALIGAAGWFTAPGVRGLLAPRAHAAPIKASVAPVAAGVVPARPCGTLPRP